MSYSVPPELSAKLSPDMDLKQVQQNTTVPSFDSNSQILNQLNPNNLTSTVKYPSPAFGFDNSVTTAPRLPQTNPLNKFVSKIASAVDYETPIRTAVDKLLNKKVIPNFSSGQLKPTSLYNNLYNNLTKNSSQNYDFAKQQISNTGNTNLDISNTSSLQNAINGSVPQELSSKQLRDLGSSPAAVNEFVAKSKEQAIGNVKELAVANAQNFLNNLLGGSPGSGIIQIAGGPGSPYANTLNDYKASVSISTYSKTEKLGSKNAKLATGSTSLKENKYLIEGISCSSNLPIGTKIIFDSPELGTRIVMEGGGNVVQQEISNSLSTSPGNIQGFALPYTGNYGLAKTDQKVRSGGSGSKLTGKLFLKDTDGKILGKYDFVNGGAGRGSIPFGTYVVSNYMTASQRAKANRSQAGSLKGKDTFDLNDVYDPVFGADRTGLLIHPATNATEGCLGIQGNWQDFVQKMNYLMAKNGGKYNIDLGPDENTVNNRNESSGIIAKIYFESEKIKKQFEKKFGGRSVQATIQLPKSGKYVKKVITPYGGVVQTVASYYPEKYGFLKSNSSNKLVKNAGLT